ncbi:DUF2087 domain-containing protein [Nonomuraea sp. NPDC046570]|uniref:DUF2087 domain-containing protein n=1 Tax=Nonomuraea sp. NPDC046570 TaxID=3155255 RepID=UPI0033D4F359
MADEEIRRVLGLLYQDDTLRTFAALILGTESGLTGDGPRLALDRLERGGLVTRDEEGAWKARPERFRELLHLTAQPAPAATPEERLLQSFLVEGRLRAIPTKRDKRLVVLHHIAGIFEPGTRYPEKDVDVALRAFHDDYVALRRHLIEEELLSRRDNVYWRSGGHVEV